MTIGRRAVRLAPTFLLIVGCRPEASESPAAIDSASAAIVTHDESAVAAAPLLVLDSEPTTRVAAAQRDFDLQYVFHGAIFPDGRIIALSTIPPKLLVFDREGRQQKAFGTLGRGPGDLMAPGGMLVVSKDSVYLPDRGNARINWFSPVSGFLGADPVEPGPMACDEPLGMLSDRRVVWLGCSAADDTGRSPTPLRVSSLDRSGGQVIANLPGLNLVAIETRYRRRLSTQRRPLRFGPNSVAAVWGSTIAVGRNESRYQIDQLSIDGRTIKSIRLDRPRRAVSAAMREAQIAAELEPMAGPMRERMVDPEESRRLAREAPFADSLPYYSHVFASADGILWVVDPIAPSDSGWTAVGFRQDGSIAGRLKSSVPSSVPLFIAADRVLVSVEDSDGVRTLAVYSLKSQGPPAPKR